jgi:hypothetical protein
MNEEQVKKLKSINYRFQWVDRLSDQEIKLY